MPMWSTGGAARPDCNRSDHANTTRVAVQSHQGDSILFDPGTFGISLLDTAMSGSKSRKGWNFLSTWAGGEPPTSNASIRRCNHLRGRHGARAEPRWARASFSIAVRLRARRAVAVACEAAPGIRVALEFEQDAGRDRGVGEVGEHAVNTEPVELQIFVHRVAFVVRDQALLLVAEGPGVHQHADLVNALDDIARRQELAARLARTGQAGGRRADDVALPRTDAVGVGFDLPQPDVGDEEAESAR